MYFVCFFPSYFTYFYHNVNDIFISISSYSLLCCKTQNSGLRSKEGKTARPNEPVQQTQHARGFIVGCTNGVTLISWEAEHTEQQIGQAFIVKNPHYQHVTYGLQSDWLHVCKAILLVQTSRATCLQKQFYWYNFAGFCSNLGARGLFSSPAGFFTGCILIGWLQVTRWGRGILPFHGKPKPKSRPPASPSPGSPT